MLTWWVLPTKTDAFGLSSKASTGAIQADQTLSGGVEFLLIHLFSEVLPTRKPISVLLFFLPHLYYLFQGITQGDYFTQQPESPFLKARDHYLFCSEATTQNLAKKKKKPEHSIKVLVIVWPNRVQVLFLTSIPMHKPYITYC